MTSYDLILEKKKKITLRIIWQAPESLHVGANREQRNLNLYLMTTFWFIVYLKTHSCKILFLFWLHQTSNKWLQHVHTEVLHTGNHTRWRKTKQTKDKCIFYSILSFRFLIQGQSESQSSSRSATNGTGTKQTTGNWIYNTSANLTAFLPKIKHPPSFRASINSVGTLNLSFGATAHEIKAFILVLICGRTKTKKLRGQNFFQL